MWAIACNSGRVCIFFNIVKHCQLVPIISRTQVWITRYFLMLWIVYVIALIYLLDNITHNFNIQIGLDLGFSFCLLDLKLFFDKNSQINLGVINPQDSLIGIKGGSLFLLGFASKLIV